jgi:hypothetical protein
MVGMCVFHPRVTSGSAADRRRYRPFINRRPSVSLDPNHDQFVRERARPGVLSDGACRPPIGQFLARPPGNCPQRSHPISPLPLPGAAAITTQTAILFWCRGLTMRATPSAQGRLPPTPLFRKRRRPIGPRVVDGGESAPSSILEIGKRQGLPST